MTASSIRTETILITTTPKNILHIFADSVNFSATFKQPLSAFSEASLEDYT